MKEGQQEIIDEIHNRIKGLGEEIRESGATINVQCTQMDVLLDTIRFLDHYEDNVKVLNTYWLRRHKEEKFSGGENNEKPSRERE